LGSSEAATLLATNYRDGFVLERNWELAELWFAMAAQWGDAGDMYDKACFSYAQAVQESAVLRGLPGFEAGLSFAEMTMAAERGHVLAMIDLATYHQIGFGVNANQAESAKWFDAAVARLRNCPSESRRQIDVAGVDGSREAVKDLVAAGLFDMEPEPMVRALRDASACAPRLSPP
ncbi:MAG: hypothetical protein SFV21_15890, partial [Rhodospirillaceae bacterium]|nr:hypothetical protein [Rhodospirillaceae bacterium]